MMHLDQKPMIVTGTQQDYYDPQYSTLLHSYCIGTYTEVEVLLLRSSATVTLEYSRTGTPTE